MKMYRSDGCPGAARRRQKTLRGTGWTSNKVARTHSYVSSLTWLGISFNAITTSQNSTITKKLLHVKKKRTEEVTEKKGRTLLLESLTLPFRILTILPVTRFT